MDFSFQPLEDTTWFALGVAATLVSAFVAQHIGYIQISIMKQEHDLNVTKATPKIGTSVKIDKRQINPPAYPPFCFLVASIYNEGELPAKQVNGHCKLVSPTKAVKEYSIPISREFLGSSPCELEICRLENGISGMTVDIGGVEGQNIRFNVDIEFGSLGWRKINQSIIPHNTNTTPRTDR